VIAGVTAGLIAGLFAGLRFACCTTRTMGYASLSDCVEDLKQHGHLKVVDVPVDPDLEIAEVQRRVFRAGGPALLFTQAKGTKFPMLGNLFGSLERARFVFRDALEPVKKLVELKVDPGNLKRRPWRYLGVPLTALRLLPKRVSSGPVFANEARIRDLPLLKSWPDDGGPFVTLPQVYTEDPNAPSLRTSNLGMYRVQLLGNRYVPDEEVGLHYQIHRGIGVHHSAALKKNQPLQVAVFVGGPPAATLAAVMPLPEGLSELAFAGALARRRMRMANPLGSLHLHAEADFVIVGEVWPNEHKPEGPFGDHLGYYSLEHPFPVMRVKKVYHRSDAIWPFTVVGRPPQEDTLFGALIHEITGPIIPTVLPGVEAVHAVDATGVHPLLLAIGSERYMPFSGATHPQELLTQANAILGQGQLSLAKYLFITERADSTALNIHDVSAFLQHMLRRLDPLRDLHFHTRTTIDTLDYSGSGLNEGSKVVVAAAGPAVRELPATVPSGLSLPSGFKEARVCIPGVLAVTAPTVESVEQGRKQQRAFCAAFSPNAPINHFVLVVLVDDSEFAARTLNNFLWVTFTRSNPASDIDGIGAQTADKHWGCQGALVIDARRKPHHAPPLIEDPAVTAQVDELFKASGPLAGLE